MMSGSEMGEVVRAALSFGGASTNRTSEIIVGSGASKELPTLFSSYAGGGVYVLFDQSLPDELLGEITGGFPEGVVMLPLTSGEETKTLEHVESLCDVLLEQGCRRDSLIVNIGGGATTDFGGFVASIFMRGVDFIHVPTTVLAAVDASIGGKTGVNLGGAKNMIGTITQPKAIVIELNALTSLSDEEFSSGMAEVLKHGLIRDASYFEQVTQDPQLRSDPDLLAQVILRSTQIKSEVVEQDERESGLRKLLNFGHTFGHAVEAYSHKTDAPLRHGEAIAIGCVFASFLSQKLGKITGDEHSRIESAFRSFDLPTRFPDALAQSEELQVLMQQDKKSVGGAIRWTLLEGIGSAVIDGSVSSALVDEAIEYIGTQDGD